MKHVGPYVPGEDGQSADLNFSNPVNVYYDYNSDDLFRSAISYFEGKTTESYFSVDSKINSQYPLAQQGHPTDKEVLNILSLPFEVENFTKRLESDFKNLYGVELNKENLEFAYRNTVMIGKGFNGEGEDVPRPLFKFNGEVNEDNMHLLAFTLCRAVECKAMNKTLEGGYNREYFEDAEHKFEAFDEKECSVFFQAPGKETVSFEMDGVEKPNEPVEPEPNNEPKPKWYQKVAAAILPFTSAGKRAKEAINRFNNAQKRFDDGQRQYDLDKKKMEEWEKTSSCAAEGRYEKNKEKLEQYYNKWHGRSGENSFTKGVKQTNLNNVKAKNQDAVNNTNKPNYSKLRENNKGKTTAIENNKILV